MAKKQSSHLVIQPKEIRIEETILFSTFRCVCVWARLFLPELSFQKGHNRKKQKNNRTTRWRLFIFYTASGERSWAAVNARRPVPRRQPSVGFSRSDISVASAASFSVIPISRKINISRLPASIEKKMNEKTFHFEIFTRVNQVLV